MPFSSQLARRTLIKVGAAVGAVVALTLTTSTSALVKGCLHADRLPQ